jgi:hypothetical protein
MVGEEHHESSDANDVDADPRRGTMRCALRRTVDFAHRYEDSSHGRTESVVPATLP